MISSAADIETGQIYAKTRRISRITEKEISQYIVGSGYLFHIVYVKAILHERLPSGK
jgi:hypothetical protein